ncbi:MAG: Chaperone protein DnaJ [Mycoplasmataceae bacterium]|nr:MAG: Chaperone protein DnaJ [Mycoplasmataceae bacterium]
MQARKSYEEILEINYDANPEDIKAAYLRLTNQGGSEEKLKEIQKAYEELYKLSIHCVIKDLLNEHKIGIWNGFWWNL